MSVSELVNRRNELKNLLLDMEFKNYFVKAFLKFISSNDFKKYMEYKNKLMENSSIEESAILIKKINYLEKYGAVSDYLYLLENCQDVSLYLSLRNELDQLELQLVENQNNDLSQITEKKLVKIK